MNEIPRDEHESTGQTPDASPPPADPGSEPAYPGAPFNKRGEVRRAPLSPDQEGSNPVEQPKNDLDLLRELREPKDILTKVHELLKKNPAGEVFAAASEALIHAGEVNLGAQFLLTAKKEEQLQMEQFIAERQEDSSRKGALAAEMSLEASKGMSQAARHQEENLLAFQGATEQFREAVEKNRSSVALMIGVADTLQRSSNGMQDAAQTISSAATRMSSNY